MDGSLKNCLITLIQPDQLQGLIESRFSPASNRASAGVEEIS
jgi:hypothetical protein